MIAVEERVDRLETAMSHLADTVERIWREMREDRLRFENSILDLERRAEKDRQQMEANRQQAQKEREQAEKVRQREHEQAEKVRQQEREQAEKERREFNKRMAEISDSMGRLIEDMVAPCGFQLAKSIFRTEEAESCAERVWRRHPTQPGRSIEYDLVAVGPTKVLIVEAKWTVAPGKAREFKEQMAALPEFFPEYAGKVLCPAVASVYLEPSVVAFLNHERIYGIAMGDETMQVVNAGAF